MQQGDVKLFQTNDDGEIIVENGLVTMSGGLDTAAYLSLFGGNEDCPGTPNCNLTWWANLNETDSAFKQVSETQHLLKSIPATSNNLRRIENAVSNDLQWMLDKNIASSINVEVTIPGVNKIKIVVAINAVGQESNFEFVENWKVEL